MLSGISPTAEGRRGGGLKRGGAGGQHPQQVGQVIKVLVALLPQWLPKLRA